MQATTNDPFAAVFQRIIEYLPSLLAGAVLLLAGLVLGWIVKRVVVQIAMLLRLERLLKSFRWGADFSKADVRYALFDTVGNVAYFLTFLVFLNAALAAMQLTVLSNLIERGVLIVPRLVVSLLIVGIGWMIAGAVAASIRKGLRREDVPRSTLIARFSKAVIVLFFTAMALAELDIAREIVIIGFAVIMVTLGVLAVVLTGFGGKDLVRKTLARLDQE